MSSSGVVLLFSSLLVMQLHATSCRRVTTHSLCKQCIDVLEVIVLHLCLKQCLCVCVHVTRTTFNFLEMIDLILHVKQCLCVCERERERVRDVFRL